MTPYFPVNTTENICDILGGGGICVVSTPHTTAGITVNENYDSDVMRESLMEMNERVPLSDGYITPRGILRCTSKRQ